MLFVYEHAIAWAAGVALGWAVARLRYARKLKAFDMPCTECTCGHQLSVHEDEGDGPCRQQIRAVHSAHLSARCPCLIFHPVRKTNPYS